MTDTDNDHLWLEDIDAPRSLDWVGERNNESLAKLQGDERYDALKSSAIEIYTSDDRIPYVTHVQGHVHNFWQDDEHVKGIWRRTTLSSYLQDAPHWEILLDIDALAKAEDEDWVYKGRTCLGPDRNRCLVHLSRGGSDASEIREFDVPTASFVDDGFVLAEAKTRVDWLDQDNLLVATDYGPGSLTTSGYPRIVKQWRRGTPLKDAQLLFEAEEADMLVAPTTAHRPEGSHTFVLRLPSFFRQDVYYLQADGNLRQVPLPGDVDFQGVFRDKLIAELRSDWTIGDRTFSTGSLVAVDLLPSVEKGEPVNVQSLLTPSPAQAVKGVSLGRDA
ncbi:MAG: S9 family peptidase, partial [Gammaproteobacteria bacterium]|nr:S9 family peptidase [Gammaproteobacteria bacterium]